MSDDKPNRWGGIAFIAILAALVLLGIYLFYRTIVGLGGFGGWFALLGRMLLQVGLVVVAFAAYAACLARIHVVICFVTGTKLRRVRVFVSFKHDYEAIATEIEHGVGGGDVEVVKLPFRNARDHDDVIAESLDAVESADAVVVVPGPEPSWMANELGLAVGSRKPIVVIKHLPAQQLSDSLYRGYPVFAWDKLQTDGLHSLRRFLSFAAKGRGDIWPQLGRGASGSAATLAKAFTAFLVVSAIFKELHRFVMAFAPGLGELLAMAWLWVIFLVVAAVFSTGFAAAFLRRLRGLAVARQKIRTRVATYEEFASVFSYLHADRTILRALERVPLEPRHERT